jgi:fructosamine-3-kinase
VSADDIRSALEQSLGLRVESIALTRGGDINDAYRAETDQGSLFVKSSPTALPGMFAAEAAGLEWLSAPGALNTPGVVGVTDGDDLPRLLALEWIDSGPVDAETLGRGLAQTHLSGAPAFGFTPGADPQAPMRFNQLALPNDPFPTFAEFYAANRIIPLADLSHKHGRLSAENTALMHRVAERMPELAGPPEPPARTHGDLWVGNVMGSADGTPYLIDPVAHGGHREVDLANLRVFGSPGARTFSAYEEVAPLADGHAERVPLWQLAMILLHVDLFGGSYEGQAVSIAKRYV